MPASQPPPSPAASGCGGARPAPEVAGLSLRRGGFQARRAQHGRFEQQRGDDQQVDGAQRHGEPDRQRRTQQRAGGPAGRDEAEQPLALLGGVEVGHERPEHRHREQVEHADPHEEHPRDMSLADVERQQQPEDRDIGDEKMVNERDKAPARQAGDHGAEYRHHGEHDEEGRREQPRQVAHAARDAHFVAQRPQDVVAREQAEKIGERPQQRAHFARAHVDDARQPAVQRLVTRHSLLVSGQGLRPSAWRISAAVIGLPNTGVP